MRTTHYQSGEAPRPRAAAPVGESFGRIAARRPAPSSPLLLSVVRPESETSPALQSRHLELAARANRALLVTAALNAVWHHIVASARGAVAAWQRGRQRRATYLALRGLDDRTLHDLGLSRSEILSVAMDVDRDDEIRRLRTTRAATALRLS
ncbi:MAG: DUF1127 domain-containing protein [Burkholderiaceae bacterium]